MKKAASMLLALALVAALLTAGALAADTLTMTVSSATDAAVGDEVTLSVSLTDNPGLATLDMSIGYDTGALELVSMEFNSDFTSGGMPQPNKDGKQMTFVKMENTGYTGEIATLTFKVLVGGASQVTVTINECLDVNEEPVVLSSTTAQGTVGSAAPCQHDWGQGVVTTEPGCETKGVRTYTCSRCPESWTEDIEPTGHAWGEGEVTTEPGCETKGVRTYTCGNDESHTKTEDIEPTGHAWGEGEVTTEPGCETKGVRTYTCGNDASHTKTEDIDPAGHAWGEGEVTTEPGCETKGVRTYTCGNDESHTKTEEIEPAGHDWDEGVVTKEATTSEAGEMLYTCLTDDSHTKTEAIPVIRPATPAPTAAPQPGGEVAKTGDDAQPVLWLMLVMASGAVTAGLLVTRKKKEN